MEFLPLKDSRGVEKSEKLDRTMEMKKLRKVQEVCSGTVRRKRRLAGSEKDTSKKRSKHENTVKEKNLSTKDTLPKTKSQAGLRKKTDKFSTRLFINMKKRILNPMEVMDIHPNISSIILPRKKNSRWCWAVFETEEKAVEALKALRGRKDIIVRAPLSEENKNALIQRTTARVKTKKSVRKKIRESWL